MANRILRDWTQSENINKLSEKSEVFFTRLIMKADDYGCYYGNLKLIKSALYPLREINESEIYQHVKECEDIGLIFCYIVDNKDYIKINNFGQRLRLMKSKFPQPNDSSPLTNDSNSPPETKRNEVETEVETEVEKKRKETKEEFFDDKYQLPYTIVNDERVYGTEHHRLGGGMSGFAIKKHCLDLEIKYDGEYGE